MHIPPVGTPSLLPRIFILPVKPKVTTTKVEEEEAEREGEEIRRGGVAQGC